MPAARLGAAVRAAREAPTARPPGFRWAWTTWAAAPVHGGSNAEPRECCARSGRWNRPREDAARQAAPQGPGPGFGGGAPRMVERLRADGIGCEPVLQAFGQVPRHRFVDTALATQAYEDTSLPIGHGQTISKPSVVARMLALLFESDEARASGSLGRVLEIGTGCGYQTALLSLLSRGVLSIERLRPLHDKARPPARLAGLDVRLVHGDGRWAMGPGPRTSTSSPPPAVTPAAFLAGPAGRRRPPGGADAGRPRRGAGAGGGRSHRRRLARAACRGGALRPPKIRPRMTQPRTGPVTGATNRAGMA
jgi:protein-L-isoaspartate(D-aspartate) O-methyltransferase